MPRTHCTVAASRVLAKQRTRFEKLYTRESKNPERAALLSRVIMDLDRVLEDILEINKYDERSGR